MKYENILSNGLLFILIGLLAGPVPSFGDDFVLDNKNVVIILDASGSMDKRMRSSSISKMEAAKEALREVLKRVPTDTHIGLLVFSGKNISNDWLYPLGPRDDARLIEAIGRPQPGGTTPLGAYIKKGGDRLLQQRARQHGYGTYRLLIVTDGEAQDQDLVDRYFPELIARGITTDVIGVDMETTHTLATRAHSYRRADDPASLKRAVAEVFAEVADTGSDTAGEEAFAEVASLPDEMAVDMLNALSASGNQPIGQEWRSERRATTTTRPARAKVSFSSWFILVIVAIVIFAFLLRALRNRR